MKIKKLCTLIFVTGYYVHFMLSYILHIFTISHTWNQPKFLKSAVVHILNGVFSIYHDKIVFLGDQMSKTQTDDAKCIEKVSDSFLHMLIK